MIRYRPMSRREIRAPGKASQRLRRSSRNVSRGGHTWGAVCSHFPRTRLAAPRHVQVIRAQGQSRHSVRVNPTMASVPPGEPAGSGGAELFRYPADGAASRWIQRRQMTPAPGDGSAHLRGTMSPSRPGTVPGHGPVPGRRRRSRLRAGHDVPAGQRGNHHRSPRREPTSLRPARTHPASRRSECWRSTAQPCRLVCLRQPENECPRLVRQARPARVVALG